MSQYITDLTSRWSKFQDRYRRLNENQVEVQEDLTLVETEHTQLLEKIETHLKAIEYVKVIMTTVTQQDIAPLENMLTSGLQSIFNPNYSVTIKIDDRGKDKTAEFMVNQLNKHTGEIESTPARETGFGIQTVLSLVLQVFFLLYEKGKGIILWDEPLTQVSEEHLDKVFTLINSLVLGEDIDILGVTHDPRLLEYGNKIYRMLDGKLTLKAGGKDEN